MSQANLNAKLEALAAMSPAQLSSQWQALSEIDLPKAPATLLRHLIAYRLQEKQLGKLPAQIERQLDRIASGRAHGSHAYGALEPTDAQTGSCKAREAILHGTRLIREWNGKTIAVTAVEGGFDWEGQVYRSLSEIARKVTGAHWSGPRFFGLKKGQG